MTSFGRALLTGPNLITLSRVTALLVVVVAYAFDAVGLALILGALAGATDNLDGWWARRTGQVSRLGEILDQFCDVTLELILLVVAVGAHRLPLVILVPYVLREIWVISLRRYAIELGENIPSRFSGKLKTGFLGWSFIPLFANLLPWLAGPRWGGLGHGLLRLGQGGICFGMFMSLWSATSYTKDFARIFERAQVGRKP
jgi:CDP-diacylglycerol--glycerol-3-phosphate 3-phosphatidyltransferase